MSSVTYSLGVSLDGCITEPDGEITAPPPGGPTLAAEAAALGLIDEYRVMVFPVTVGAGIPYVPQHERLWRTDP